MSTLLQSDFTTEQMGEDNLGRILLYISELFKDQRGLLGFGKYLSDPTRYTDLLKQYSTFSTR